ncbi:MAG: polynucleotide adenylyltransferase [Firmicutes bacterium HGW-Firmicutes-1]|nr:MAG: polynucleotide adenylyltransferase [Firmicutes bacterium HGW-Firmicutes-1]
MKINLPNNVNEIIRKLDEYGYEAYAVGGCVRDSILGVSPDDWDITTSALPGQVKKLFKKTVDTGLKHGTVTVFINQIPYEVTTYRIDGVYEDHRKPMDVEFTLEVVEDLRRRDFTMNAMAYNEKNGLVDVYFGIEDIKRQIVRCVGSPSERFNEDALRMLRAIRFCAKLGFEMDEATEAAIIQCAPLIEKISGERIHMEMTKILISNNPHFIEKLTSLGLMAYIIPEFMKNVGVEQHNKHHIYTVDNHIYEAIKNVEASETLRWTLLLHDIGKGYCKTIDDEGVGHFYNHPKLSVIIAKEVLNRLRFDNKTISDILKLIEHHDYRIEADMKQVRTAINKIGEELFEEYIKVQRADIRAQNPAYMEEHLTRLDEILVCYREIIESRQCTSLKDLQINGKDLTDLGLPQGKTIGLILNQLLEMVIEEPGHNNRDWLLNRALQLNKEN